jgi:hypothetical protein
MRRAALLDSLRDRKNAGRTRPTHSLEPVFFGGTCCAASCFDLPIPDEPNRKMGLSLSPPFSRPREALFAS